MLRRFEGHVLRHRAGFQLTPLADALSILLGAATCVYVFVGIRFAIGLARRPAGTPGSAPVAFVSVVIAARNEAEWIGPCLKSLARQDFDPDRFEVIVVDDASTDGTAEVVARYPGATLLDVGDGYADHVAKKRPMAVGVARARGDLILTTDADCRVSEGWISSMVAEASTGADVVIGYSELAPGLRGAGARLQSFDFFAMLVAAAGASGAGFAWAATGQNFGFRRSVFDRVRGYEQIRRRPSGDDVLLLQLFRRAGAVIRFSQRPRSFVRTARAETVAGFLNQRVRWASNAPIQLRLNPAFFAYLLATGAVSLLAPLVLFMPGFGQIAAACWLTRVLTDLTVCALGARRFGRTDLLWSLPAWELLQAPFVFYVALVGPVIGFTWRGRRHASGSDQTGQHEPPGRTDSQVAHPTSTQSRE